MSDAAHPADSRGPAKPRKPPGDSAIEPRKKVGDKPEPEISPKPKLRDKKTALKGKATGSDAELATAAEHPHHPREAARDSGEKSAAGETAKTPKDGVSLTTSKAEMKVEARHDARHDAKHDSRHDSKHDARHDAKHDSRDHKHDSSDDSGDSKVHDRKDARGDSRGEADTPDPAVDESDDETAAAARATRDSADANVAAAQAEAADLPELPDLPDVAPDEDEKFHAMCAWLSAAALILAMVCPFYFVGPLLYWLRYRRRSRFVAFHAKQGLWWSCLATGLIWVVGLAAGLVLGSIFGLEFVGLNLVALVPVQVTIIIWFVWIGLKALHGVKYRTPIIGRLAESAPQKWF